MLEAFFESISWPMERPPAYGAFHILFTLIGFGVCGFSAWKLRNVSDKTAGRILFFCGGETFLWRDGDKTLRDLVIDAKKMGFFSNFVKVFPPPPRFYKQKEENRVLAHRALRT